MDSRHLINQLCDSTVPVLKYPLTFEGSGFAVGNAGYDKSVSTGEVKIVTKDADGKVLDTYDSDTCGFQDSGAFVSIINALKDTFGVEAIWPRLTRHDLDGKITVSCDVGIGDYIVETYGTLQVDVDGEPKMVKQPDLNAERLAEYCAGGSDYAEMRRDLDVLVGAVPHGPAAKAEKKLAKKVKAAFNALKEQLGDDEDLELDESELPKPSVDKMRADIEGSYDQIEDFYQKFVGDEKIWPKGYGQTESWVHCVMDNYVGAWNRTHDRELTDGEFDELYDKVWNGVF